MLSCLEGKMPTPHLFTFPSNQVITKSAENIGDLLLEKFREGKKVSLFLSGGSAVEMYQELFTYIPAQLGTIQTPQIKVALVDERYGIYGHADSNEQLLREKGIIDLVTSLGAQFIGILSPQNLSVTQTTSSANQHYAQLLTAKSYRVALLGLGEDGHTAGWLPTQTNEKFQNLYESTHPLVYYEVDPTDSSNPYLKRVTISTTLIPQFDQIIVYTKGASKKAAIEHLMKQDTPIHQTPAIALYQASSPPLILTDHEYFPKN